VRRRVPHIELYRKIRQSDVTEAHKTVASPASDLRHHH